MAASIKGVDPALGLILGVDEKYTWAAQERAQRRSGLPEGGETAAMRCIVFLVLAAGVAVQQSSTAHRQFDVASVKPVQPPTVSDLASGRYRINWRLQAGTRVNIMAKLGEIIAGAYGLEPNQVKGVPTWALGLGGVYRIVAETTQPATAEQMQIMLRNLLRDRFKLKVNIENRAVSGYDLVVEKGGLKNLPAGAAGSRSPLFNQTMADFAKTLEPDPNGYRCNCSSGYLPVADKTGLKGTYNFYAALGKDYFAPATPPAVQSDGVESVTLDELLREAIGLGLVRDKVTVPLLTVVHVEKPTPD